MGGGDMSGFLDLRPKSKKWIHCWCHLQRDSLLFFANKQDVKPKGIIFLMSCTAKMIQIKDRRYAFELVTPAQTYQLSAGSYAVMLEWIKSINDTSKRLIEEKVDSGPLISQKAGFIWKQSPSALKGFQKRYFTLSGPVLYYWKPQMTTGKPIGAILLTGSKVVALNDKKGIFEIHTQDRKYVLHGENPEESKIWVGLIQKGQQQNEKYDRSMSMIDLDSKSAVEPKRRSSM